MPATKFTAKPPVSLQRVMGVGRVVVKSDYLLPGKLFIDKLEIKVSVKSLPPKPTMSSGGEMIF